MKRYAAVPCVRVAVWPLARPLSTLSALEDL